MTLIHILITFVFVQKDEKIELFLSNTVRLLINFYNLYFYYLFEQIRQFIRLYY